MNKLDITVDASMCELDHTPGLMQYIPVPFHILWNKKKSESVYQEISTEEEKRGFILGIKYALEQI